MALYLVTGGAGFIGSAIVRRLLGEGARVRVVDDFSTGLEVNLEEVFDRIEFIEGDLSDLGVARRAVEKVDYILHQAAIPSVPRSVEDPITTNRANVTATLNVLAAARDGRVKRIVFASSSSVYGNAEILPKVETMRDNPISPYAVSKLAGEKYCLAFHQVYGMPTVSLRYFNVFGPRQNPNSPYSGVISKFISAALDGTHPTVYGDGEQSRDFTYVDNVVDANLLACKAEGAEGSVFNVGTGDRHSLNELLRILAHIAGREWQPRYVERRKGDVQHSQADIERARQLLGYRLRVGFEEGLRRTFSWFQDARRVSQSHRR